MVVVSFGCDLRGDDRAIGCAYRFEPRPRRFHRLPGKTSGSLPLMILANLAPVALLLVLLLHCRKSGLSPIP